MTDTLYDGLRVGDADDLDESEAAARGSCDAKDVGASLVNSVNALGDDAA